MILLYRVPYTCMDHTYMKQILFCAIFPKFIQFSTFVTCEPCVLSNIVTLFRYVSLFDNDHTNFYCNNIHFTSLLFFFFFSPFTLLCCVSSFNGKNVVLPLLLLSLIICSTCNGDCHSNETRRNNIKWKKK